MMWPKTHICVLSAEILRNVAANVIWSLKVFGEHFAEVSFVEVNGTFFGPHCNWYIMLTAASAVYD